MSSDRISPGLSALEPSYEVIREIGHGGTSVVYLARERATNAEVAIKLIRSKYLGDDEAMGRFAREARFLEHLVHPNIVRVREVLELGDAGLAIVMSHVPGRTLKDLIRQEGRLTPERAERFTRDIARALGAAHAMGIVHRDVKPENVFVDADDRPLLADFGLARSMTGDSQLTMAGVAIGTPAYMAPEQIEGASLDARGDVYSLGLVAWEMLTGHRPWEGESLYAVLYHQRYEQLPDIRDLRDDVPDTLGDTIAVAIEKNPAMRWQNAAQVIEALDGAAPLRRTTRRPPLSADTLRFTRPAAGGGAHHPDAGAQPHTAWAPAPPLPATPSAPRTVTPVLPPPPRANVPFVELGPASMPAGRAAHEPSFIGSAAFASLAAELDAQDEEPVSGTRRRYILGLGGVAAIVTLVVVAANLQGRSSEAHRAPTLVSGGFTVNDSSGKSLSGTRPPPSTAAPTPDAGAKPASRQVGPVATVASSAQSPPQLPETRKSPPPMRLPVRQQSVESAKPTDKKAGKQSDDSPSPNTATKSDSKAAPNSRSNKTLAASADKAADRSPADRPTPTPTPTPTPPPAPIAEPITSRITVAAGGLHSCMLNAEGRAYCWGGNDRGQLGAGGPNSVATPLAVAGDVRFTGIATGLSHSCAIARGGAAWCWGENERGQLGDRSTMAHQAPMRVADVRMFTAIGVGAAHSCALDSQREALCWGSNSHGQLGSDGLVAEVSAPTLVVGDHHYSMIVLGWNFACGLDGGRAFCWGENANGQLGDGSITDRRVPAMVGGGLAFATIATGATHACGITPRGEAYCWGNNYGGQLGDGTRLSREVPTAVKTSLRFVAIATGALHTCALTADGEAYCWGRDNYGQLGDGGTAQDSAEPVRVVGDHSFAAVRAFGSHTCATTASGEAFCWGYNLDGQLGDGSRVNRTRPVYVEPPPGT
jgi:serine/threonine protein kinase/alpha-tubulin suppressor-like RCC1 family protein